MRDNEQLAARIRAVQDVTENMRISAVRMPLHAREDIYELVSPETARIPQTRGMWDSCRCYSYLKGIFCRILSIFLIILCFETACFRSLLCSFFCLHRFLISF